MSTYEQKMHELILSGKWKPGDPVPTELIEASAGVGVGPGLPDPVGSPDNPLELEAMTVIGQPPKAGQAPQAGYASIYDDLGPQDVKQLAGMGDLERQLGVAEAMRDTERLKGRYVSQGRMYVADSPLAHIVRGTKIYKGGKRAREIGEEQTAGRQTIIDLLRNRNRENADLDIDQIVDPFMENGSNGGMRYS